MPALPLSPLSQILRDALAPALALADALASIPEPPPVPGVEGATSACPGFGPAGSTVCERRPDGVCEPCGLVPEDTRWTRVPRPEWSCQYCQGASENRHGPCDLCGDRGIPDQHHAGARRATQRTIRDRLKLRPEAQPLRYCQHLYRDSDGQCGRCGYRAQLPPILASWHGEHPQPNDPPAPILDRVAGTLATLAHRERDAARTYRARGDEAMLSCPPDSDAARMLWQLAHAAECRAFALDHAHAVVTLAPDHPGDTFDQLAMRAALLAVEHPSS